jgi:hypothetical protein
VKLFLRSPLTGIAKTTLSGEPKISFDWRLLSMMIFHAITDAIGRVIAPEFSDWWKDLRCPDALA